MKALRIVAAMSSIGFGFGFNLVEAAQPSNTGTSKVAATSRQSTGAISRVEAIGAIGADLDSPTAPAASGSSVSPLPAKTNQITASADHTFSDPQYSVTGKFPEEWRIQQTLRW